jgi:hypothetical protein
MKRKEVVSLEYVLMISDEGSMTEKGGRKRGDDDMQSDLESLAKNVKSIIGC